MGDVDCPVEEFAGAASVGVAGGSGAIVKFQAEVKALLPALFVALTLQKYIVPGVRELTAFEGELKVASSTTTLVANVGSVEICTL